MKITLILYDKNYSLEDSPLFLYQYDQHLFQNEALLIRETHSGLCEVFYLYTLSFADVAYFLHVKCEVLNFCFITILRNRFMSVHQCFTVYAVHQV